ncbi:MAG: IS21 family transposase [Acidimicrobiales bacterium]
MLPKEKEMEVLEAYDLTKSYRSAAQLCGVDHHTVARLVAARAVGAELEGEPVVRSKVAEAFADKITEWITRSDGKVRADVCHDRLIAMGYKGSERTTRRVVRALKSAYEHEHHRIYKPWITEPGMWLQYDFGTGPVIDHLKVVLFCAWLAWSRFRVIIALQDKSLASVIAALDRTFHICGGAPTFVLTDNERTVTDAHIAGIAVRNRTAVDISRYYGVTIATCVPFDPESKGGSESSVKLAKADLVPTEYNLLDDYSSFAELEHACDALSGQLNSRLHAVTQQVPEDMLAEERACLHAVPDTPYTAAFGESRRVGWSSTVSFRRARYSVPDRLCDTSVWVREKAGEVVIVAGEGSGAHEVARHRLVGPGQTSITDAHYTHHRDRDPLSRTPRPTNDAERAFLSLGEGAKRYLVEAAANGARRIEARMKEAVTLASLHGRGPVDTALGIAAMAGRFSEGDLGSILVHGAAAAMVPLPPAEHSLSGGTEMWSALGGAEDEEDER